MEKAFFGGGGIRKLKKIIRVVIVLLSSFGLRYFYSLVCLYYLMKPHTFLKVIKASKNGA